jgi:hypothetical protein
MLIYTIAAGTALSHLIDYGISNILVLETCSHGTNPIYYLAIRIFGGDPHHGGKKTGYSTDDYTQKLSKKFFFLFKDTEYGVGISCSHRNPYFSDLIKAGQAYLIPIGLLKYIPFVEKRFYRRAHSFFPDTILQLG